MIRTIRKYRRSMLGLLTFLMACLLMTSFGVDFAHKGPSVSAIEIDDLKISHEKFAETRRTIDNEYRRRLGANYDELAKAMKLDSSEEAVDQIISSTVILKDAKKRGMHAGKEELRDTIAAQYPGAGAQELSAYAHEKGLTPDQFLEEVADDALKAQYMRLLGDASLPSVREARALFDYAESEYAVSYVEFDPAKYLKTVPAPSEEEIETYYKENGPEFELPARLSYEYVEFAPRDFEKEAEITDEDIELYYADNQDSYQNPEAFNVRHIQLNYPKESDPAKLIQVKEKAQSILEKAKAGENFQSLVNQYTEDFATRANGGSLGWVPKGKYPASFDAAIEKVKDGGVADLIETDYGFHIAMVEGYRPKAPKELSEVKGEIETALRKDQAPAYAEAKAHDFYDAWSTKDESLAEAAGQMNRNLKSTDNYLTEDQDPSPELAGLTKKLLESPGEEKQIIELKDSLVVVSIKDFKDTEIPPLKTVHDRIVETLKKSASRRAADKASKDFLEKAKNADNIEIVAKESKLEVSKNSELKPNKRGEGIFANDDVAKTVFSVDVPMARPAKVVSTGGKYYVFQVSGIKKPDAKEFAPKELQYRIQAMQTSGKILVSAMITQLKNSSVIHVDESLSARDS